MPKHKPDKPDNSEDNSQISGSSSDSATHNTANSPLDNHTEQLTNWHSYKRIRLVCMDDLSAAQWRQLHSFFRNRELADWNGAKPLRWPLWLFRHMMRREEAQGERIHFGIQNEKNQLIGSIELYNLRPTPPEQPHIATLGVMIGLPELWGQGYGSEAVQALVRWSFGHFGLEYVRLSTFGHNKRAQRAFASCGFREVGRTSKYHDQGEFITVYMEIAKEDWQLEQENYK